MLAEIIIFCINNVVCQQDTQQYPWFYVTKQLKKNGITNKNGKQVYQTNYYF